MPIPLESNIIPIGAKIPLNFVIFDFLVAMVVEINTKLAFGKRHIVINCLADACLHVVNLVKMSEYEFAIRGVV